METPLSGILEAAAKSVARTIYSEFGRKIVQAGFLSSFKIN